MPAGLGALLRSASDAMVIVEPSRRIAFLNPPAESLFGYARGELLGQPIGLIIPEGVELVGRRKDGTAFALDADFAPMAMPSGEMVVVSIRDGSARRRAEEERARAEQALRIREDFIGVVAHDLRNPLHAIAISAELALRDLSADESQPRARRAAANIAHLTERTQRLVDDLLDVALIDAGAVRIARRPCDVEESVAEVVAMLEPAAAEKGIRIVARGALRRTVSADPERLFQLLSNLVGNAIKFTGEGGTITVEVAGPEGEPRFTVRDDGVGIPVEHLPRVFGRYWRGERSERRGAGLGLFICRGLVEAHGGRIWIESERGRGTAVHFTLPSPAPRVESAPSPEPPRVLVAVADDAEHERLRALLPAEGDRWRVQFAGSGAAAMAAIERAPFDLLLVDLGAPDLDGAALLQRVKEAQPGVARVALAARDDAALLRALPAAQQVLEKPCAPDALREVIERVLRLQRSLDNDALRRTAGGLASLPSLPTTYSDLLASMSDPLVSARDLARVVEQDSAMCVKLLQLANSAYFGSGREVVRVEDAIGRLGEVNLLGLAISVHIFSSLPGAVDRALLERIQTEGLMSARLAKRMARTAEESQLAFTAALVHDVGRVVLSLHQPDLYRELARETSLPLHELERQTFGVTHAEVGGHLLGLWGLPIPLVEAVAFHHDPTRVATRRFDVVAAVYASDALVQELVTGNPEIDLEYLARLGVSDELPAWRSMAASFA